MRIKGHNYDEYYFNGCRVAQQLLVFAVWEGRNEGRKEIFYLTTHSTHFIYGHMTKDKSFRLAARVLLYAPYHREDTTYHGLCYTSRGSLDRTSRYGIDMCQ